MSDIFENIERFRYPDHIVRDVFSIARKQTDQEKYLYDLISGIYNNNPPHGMLDRIYINYEKDEKFSGRSRYSDKSIHFTAQYVQDCMNAGEQGKDFLKKTFFHEQYHIENLHDPDSIDSDKVSVSSILAVGGALLGGVASLLLPVKNKVLGLLGGALAGLATGFYLKRSKDNRIIEFECDLNGIQKGAEGLSQDEKIKYLENCAQDFSSDIQSRNKFISNDRLDALVEPLNDHPVGFKRDKMANEVLQRVKDGEDLNDVVTKIKTRLQQARTVKGFFTDRLAFESTAEGFKAK